MTMGRIISFRIARMTRECGGYGRDGVSAYAVCISNDGKDVNKSRPLDQIAPAEFDPWQFVKYPQYLERSTILQVVQNSK